MFIYSLSTSYIGIIFAYCLLFITFHINMVLLEQVENLLQLICNICQINGGRKKKQIRTPQIYEHVHQDTQASQECDLLASNQDRPQPCAPITPILVFQPPAVLALLTCRRGAYGGPKHLFKWHFLLHNIEIVGGYSHYSSAEFKTVTY